MMSNLNPIRKALSAVAAAALWAAGTSSAAAQVRPLYTKASVKQWDPSELMPIYSGMPFDDRDSIRLDRVPAATSVDSAKATFDKRAAAAIRVITTNALDGLHGEAYGTAVLADFAYQDYFNDLYMGNLYRQFAAASLKNQKAGKTGSGGDYDFLLQFYLSLVYRYYDDLAAFACNAKSPCGNGNTNLADHIINDLLNVRGPLDQHESEYIRISLGNLLSVPETENHLLATETARYLTNQLLFPRTHDPAYDNRRNGNGNDPQATAVWLLHTLRSILTNDFTEYNARPYQDIIMMSLVNLESYAYDGDVKLAARMALDYISAKVAVSSNDLRRVPPFRRLNQDQNYGPVSPDGWLTSPVLLPRQIPPNPEATTYEPDPQGTWYAGLAGNTGLAGNSLPKDGIGNFGQSMMFAGIHDYRVPDPILDLFVNPANRHFYQRLEHHNETRDAGTTVVVDELYSGSPSYLITAGGHPTDYAYLPIGFDHTAPWGASEDLGAAMPTTFMPTGAGVHLCYTPVQCDGNGLSLREMIQFDQYAANPSGLAGVITGIGQGIFGGGGSHYHMCVAVDFACGVSVYLPEGIRNPVSPDTSVVKQGPWTFVDRGHLGEDKPGFYLAIYQGAAPQLAFLEAYDTWLHPGLAFDDFRTRVLAQYGTAKFTNSGANTWMTQSGQRIEFWVDPSSDSSAVTFLSSRPPFNGQFAAGDVINSEQGSGIVTLWNIGFGGRQIKLDMSDVFHPARTSETGDFETAEDSDARHHVVWVNFDPNVPHGTGGDIYRPFQKLADAQAAVLSPGVINILPGSTPETNVILGGKNVTLRAVAPGAVIGRH